MRRRLRQDDGWALVTAVIVMMLMLTIGLSAYAVVDTQTGQSKLERNRESSFNLTEGALQQQGYVLGTSWPATAPGYPASCTQASAATGCPVPANLVSGNFSEVDYSSGVTWTTRVRDNPNGSDLYDASVETTPCQGTTTTPCTWDANGDNKLWVYAKARVRGRTRVLVALLKRERLTEGLPRAVLRADHFSVTNAGNKVVIDSTGSQVVVRCQNTPSGQLCADYDASKGQVSPPDSVVTEPPQTQPTMDAGQLARFEDAARGANPPTYYTSCPASLTGAVVYIDLANGGDCSYTGNSTFNSSSAPGLVIMPKGTITFRGGVTYYGVLYLANQQGSTGVVADIGGNGGVIGGVIIDRGGGIDVGSNGQSGVNNANLQYDPNAFNRIQTYGTAGLVQNTWRELPPGS